MPSSVQPAAAPHNCSNMPRFSLKRLLLIEVQTSGFSSNFPSVLMGLIATQYVSSRYRPATRFPAPLHRQPKHARQDYEYPGLLFLGTHDSYEIKYEWSPVEDWTKIASRIITSVLINLVAVGHVSIYRVEDKKHFLFGLIKVRYENYQLFQKVTLFLLLSISPLANVLANIWLP